MGERTVAVVCAGQRALESAALLLRRLPTRARRSLTRRSVRPAGATWLKPRVESVIRLTPHAAVLKAADSGRGVHLGVLGLLVRLDRPGPAWFRQDPG
jgi:hypothetical protein